MGTWLLKLKKLHAHLKIQSSRYQSMHGVRFFHELLFQEDGTQSYIRTILRYGAVMETLVMTRMAKKYQHQNWTSQKFIQDVAIKIMKNMLMEIVTKHVRTANLIDGMYLEGLTRMIIKEYQEHGPENDVPLHLIKQG